MGFGATQEVLLSFISNVPDYISKESLPPNFCDVNLTEYVIEDIMEKSKISHNDAIHLKIGTIFL